MQEAPPPLVIILPADVLEELKRPPTPAPPPPPALDLTLPTAAYVAAVASAWTSAASTCVEQSCTTITPTLPTVSNGPKALGWGLAIQGFTLYLVHAWVAPHWPRVAQGVLYGLAALHAISAADHVSTARRRAKGTL
jgi:hypothetical protein